METVLPRHRRSVFTFCSADLCLSSRLSSFKFYRKQSDPGTGCTPSTWIFSCQNHSTDAPYSFNYLVRLPEGKTDESCRACKKSIALLLIGGIVDNAGRLTLISLPPPPWYRGIIGQKDTLRSKRLKQSALANSTCHVIWRSFIPSRTRAVMLSRERGALNKQAIMV